MFKFSWMLWAFEGNTAMSRPKKSISTAAASLLFSNS